MFVPSSKQNASTRKFPLPVIPRLRCQTPIIGLPHGVAQALCLVKK